MERSRVSIYFYEDFTKTLRFRHFECLNRKDLWVGNGIIQPDSWRLHMEEHFTRNKV